MLWYYISNGEQIGPVNEENLKELASTGVITSSTQMWKEGMSAWKTAGELGIAVSPPPPPTIFSSSSDKAKANTVLKNSLLKKISIGLLGAFIFLIFLGVILPEEANTENLYQNKDESLQGLYNDNTLEISLEDASSDYLSAINALLKCKKEYIPYHLNGKVQEYSDDRVLVFGTFMPSGEFRNYAKLGYEKNISFIVKNYTNEEITSGHYSGIGYYDSQTTGKNAFGGSARVFIFNRNATALELAEEHTVSTRTKYQKARQEKILSLLQVPRLDKSQGELNFSNFLNKIEPLKNYGDVEVLMSTANYRRNQGLYIGYTGDISIIDTYTEMQPLLEWLNETKETMATIDPSFVNPEAEYSTLKKYITKHKEVLNKINTIIKLVPEEQSVKHKMNEIKNIITESLNSHSQFHEDMQVLYNPPGMEERLKAGESRRSLLRELNKPIVKKLGEKSKLIPMVPSIDSNMNDLLTLKIKIKESMKNEKEVGQIEYPSGYLAFSKERCEIIWHVLNDKLYNLYYKSEYKNFELETPAHFIIHDDLSPFTEGEHRVSTKMPELHVLSFPKYLKNGLIHYDVLYIQPVNKEICTPIAVSIRSHDTPPTFGVTSLYYDPLLRKDALP